MITGNTKLTEFNEFFIKNYKYLLGFAKSINTKNDYESLLHNCYLKAYQRILLSGYSGCTYLNFIRVIIMNQYKTTYRDNKRGDNKNTIDISNNNYSEEVEENLLNEYDYEEQSKAYDQQMSYINTMAFDYVNKYFNAKENMVFKTYYVLKHKHLNYKQLALVTNMSITSVSNIIKKIKKELIENLIIYINTGERKMELEEKIIGVENLLKKDLRHNLGEYKSWYLAIFNKCWTGCGCQLDNLRQSLIVWLQKQKQLLAEEQKKLVSMNN